jgi:ribosomal protein L40E
MWLTSAAAIGLANASASESSAAVPSAEVETAPIMETAPTTPTLPEAAALAQIDAALAVLTSGSAAHVALSAARETAVGALALAEAEAQRQSDKASEVAQVRTLALPEATIAALVAAIEARYAPVPEVAPEPEVALPAGKKPVSPRTAAINAAAVSADSARAAGNLRGFDSKWAALLTGVARTSGTRFASIAAFGGDGVANYADYQSLVAQIRHYMRFQLNIGGKGDSYAVTPWLFALGIHHAAQSKGDDSLPLKFAGAAQVALYPDGRFRLALANNREVRFPSRDSGAMAVWTGGSENAPEAAQSAPTAHVPTPPTPPTSPAPTAPSSAPEAAQTITRTARCQHCQTRNVADASECESCGSTDWLLA